MAKKKKHRKSKKGGQFERDMCKALSIWWTGKAALDDCFWRVGGSGGRATVRGRKGKATSGQCGDICATDARGIPFTDVLAVEMKCGYSEDSIQDVLDKPLGGAQQKWEGWHQQVYNSMKHSGAFAWIIIQRRDRREDLVWFPIRLLNELKKIEVNMKVRKMMYFLVPVTHVYKKKYKVKVGRKAKTRSKIERIETIEEKVVGMPLWDFLNHVKPDHIKRLSKYL